MSSRIIAVAGIIGSGKDTVGDYLVKHEGFKRVSFGSSLKDAVAAMFHWDRLLLDGVTEESRKWRDEPDEWWTDKLDLGVQITPRWVLQNFATEVVRNHFHPEFWILSLANEIMKYQGPVVITDARFLNEFAFVREAKGQIVGVHRRQPHWLKPFYKGMEQFTLNGLTIPEVDLQNSATRNAVVDYGHKIMSRLRNEDRVHESEWQHVLWNDYDKVIDNRGTLEQLYQQIEDLLLGK